MKKRLAFGVTLLLLIAALLAVTGILRGTQNDNETQVLKYKDLVEQYKELTNSWLITHEDQQELAVEKSNLDSETKKLILANDRLAQELATKNSNLFDEKRKLIFENDRLAQELAVEKFNLDSENKKLILENERISWIISINDENLEDLFKFRNAEYIPRKVRQAVVDVRVTFRGTFADFDKFFAIPRPPFDDNEIATYSWSTIGTVVDIESIDPQIVVARHALFAKSDSESELKKFLKISVSPYGEKSGHSTPISGVMEFPDLDIAMLNAPSDLWASALPLYRFPHVVTREIVSHVYTVYDKVGIESKISLAHPLSESEGYALRLVGVSYKNFLSLDGRFLPGDSGSPIFITKDKVIYVAGFVLRRYTGKRDDGLAIKASKIQDALLAYQQQHQQP